MSKFSTLNKTFESKFDVTTEGKEFTTLKDLFAVNGKTPITVRGFFINTKSKFGANPIAILDDCLVNLPKHLTEQVEDIINDDEMVADVNGGHCGISIYEYENKKYGGTDFSVNFVDL